MHTSTRNKRVQRPFINFPIRGLMSVRHQVEIRKEKRKKKRPKLLCRQTWCSTRIYTESFSSRVMIIIIMIREWMGHCECSVAFNSIIFGNARKIYFETISVEHMAFNFCDYLSAKMTTSTTDENDNEKENDDDCKYINKMIVV